MRITLFLLVAGMLSVSANSYSQKITFKGRNVAFATVLEAIRKQSGYTIFSTKNVLNSVQPLTLDARGVELDEFLRMIIANQPIGYQLEDRTISFFKKEPPPIPVKEEVVQQQQFLTGRVTNAETGEVIDGVTVRVKGADYMVSTNTKGQFQIPLSAIAVNSVIVFSYIGMKSKEEIYTNQRALNVQLVPNADAIKDVVVTGIYQRNKESFTGSSATYTVKELQMVGNQNILQSLKTLDPSFAIVDNNLFGSDPNRLPDIEIRGKSSVIGLTDEYSSNPNQPLFILDGFESTLAIISDLSMDRVERITLLKDAAAAAIYGSKAANGVVVVETKSPVPGQLRVNYTMNGNVSFADLTDYNLMNAEEKLQFELLSQFYGLLDAQGKIILGSNLNSEANYLDRLKEVRRGVNTYWPNEPLRTALTQRHTLFAEGGDANLRYSVSFNHGITNGVMKGSDRQATNGNVRLLYRRGKFSVNNSLSIDNVKSNKETSPFSDFTRANPYHRKYNDDGSIKMLLEDFSATRSGEAPVYSPLYDVSNLNINEQLSLGFTNNFEMEWHVAEPLRVRGRLGLRSFSTRDEIFRSPFNTEFLNTDALERGSYRETNGRNANYDGDLSLTYGKVFAEKHMLNAVGGARMEQATRLQSAYTVRGFIDDEFSNPNFALSYPEGKRPDYNESKRRGASFFVNMGYAYDQRYLMDATLRSDGASVFGTEKQFSNIWSVGLAWNAHKETWIKSAKWIDQLRLRGSIGNPGNQNFDDYISMRIYRYNNENRNPFGASTIISNMGNRGLKWQTTLDRNIGLDITTFRNRLRLNVDYFVKSTDPLLVFVSLPASTGVTRVAQNIGAQVTNGFTISSDYSIIRKEQLTWRINLNMRQLKAEYRKMGNQLNNFNEANKSRNLIRYYDGGSPSDLWAVRSVGIDPATGREIFLNKNGEQTFVHDFKDEVIVGNSDPDLEGVFGTSLFFKGFSVSINLRYRFGGQAFMQTLYEKVENISSRNVVLNQDKRALYDRWKQPGDEAKFKAISRTEQTPMSSRFVQDNDMLIGESFSLGYESINAAWLKSIRASSVTFRVYMNDIFHISTIKNERGIDYPFARSVSFSAGIRF
ncbi:SusC/RagA family TonB-linked outer membrane protein [Sphingobacterium sp. C459-1T]|uniref:SusC/RagA family TonB-linked outer membrane protein n=2 Tax=Sphingobacterium faecale TaxID=2803775 RepID=A0ABS1QXM9_9SPHI|nr:SusC/RagA family TonB-linked outer membrane protein [Sphingobacterium faecale]